MTLATINVVTAAVMIIISSIVVGTYVVYYPLVLSSKHHKRLTNSWTSPFVVPFLYQGNPMLTQYSSR